MTILKIISHSEQQTEALAKRMAASFADGDLIVLSGPLGAGKTCFVRGLAAGQGIDAALVSSPSYTFVNEYTASLPLYHLDLYRLTSTDELTEIGWDEYRSRSGVMVVEWGEKAGSWLPDRFYRVNFHILNEQDREIDISLVQP